MSSSVSRKSLYLDKYDSFGDFDCEALRLLVRKIRRPHKRILEVGSWLGAGSTTVIIKELQPDGASEASGFLVCVDTWRGSPNVQKHMDIARQYDLFGTFMHNVSLANGSGVVKSMVMTSLEAAALLADQSFDMVFIDGDHAYSSTIADIAAWLPKVAPGGILCGHDCETRLNKTNSSHFSLHRNADSVAALAPPFLVNHPGVILAVHENFGHKAHLWAEEELILSDGRPGRATIWDVMV